MGSFIQAGMSMVNNLQQNRNAQATLKAQEQQANAQSEVVRANAATQGAETAQRTRSVIGAQQVGYGANGVDTASGSALNTMAQTAAMGQHDINTIQNNAAMQAWGLGKQAEMARLQRKQLSKASGISMLATGAQGYAQGGGQWPSFGSDDSGSTNSTLLTSNKSGRTSYGGSKSYSSYWS